MQTPLVLASLFTLFAVSAIGKDEEKTQTKLPMEVEQALANPEKAVLYSLEPESFRPSVGHGDLYGFKILGQTPLKAPQTTTAAAVFRAAVAASDGLPLACFQPRHALGITFHQHLYDLLLCFECGRLYVFRDNILMISLGAVGSSEVLNRMLTEAKVPLAYAETKEGKEAQLRAEEQQQKQQEAAIKRWFSAMPQSIRPIWDFDVEPIDGPKLKSLHEAVAREFPDFGQRSAALFGWYGFGEGPWSGYYGWEGIAEILLLDMPTADLIKTAQRDDLTPAQLEGAARFFSGTGFSRKRPQDLKALPAALKKRLLTHCLQSKDETKILEGRDAFEK